MSKFWSNIVHELTPYVPGEQPQDQQYIKLNTNENPYPPSPNVIRAIKEAANSDLRKYPDPVSDELRKTIANSFNVKKEQVFVGNGSDEVLAFSFQAFFSPGDTILFPDITYSFYPVYCQLFQIKHKSVRLNDDFSIPVEGFFEQNNGVIFPNPNAPTGRYLPLDAIRTILDENKDQVVIVDEAYIDFGGETAISLVDEYPNLLVIQTLSKSRSLAGIRIGFAVGHKDLIDGIDRIKNSINSYTLDRVALASGVEALNDKAYFEETRNKVIHTRNKVTAQMEELGFTVIPSTANFIFATHPNYDAKNLYETLKTNGILVRYFNKDRIDQYLRISIGTDEEMDQFIKKIKDIISK